MKKYWISGAVIAVVVAVIVALSMSLFGGDKFVGTWYAVKLKPKILFISPYIKELEITKNGDYYLITIHYHSYSLEKKWRDKIRKGEFIATKTEKNCLEVIYCGTKVSLNYNEKDETISSDRICYKKLDTSMEELKAKTEPEMIKAIKERDEALKTTDGLGFHYDDIKFKK